MATFLIFIRFIAASANIAGWIGAFISAMSGDYSDAMIFLSMCIVATVVYVAAEKIEAIN